jgi:hypothetical protein
MQNKTIKTILFVIIFSIAMAFLESAVVIYIRALYYPEGFNFPMKIIEEKILITEFFRELATMIMLLSIGIFAGRRAVERFAYFIFSFAIWDIFYYVFLKVILNWPESLMTWDVLFFIPTTWIGPVIAPVINSLMMIILALLIILSVEKTGKAKIGSLAWTLLIVGSLVVILSYTIDYSRFILGRFSFGDLFSATNNKEVMQYVTQYIPVSFNWMIFGAGAIMHATGIYLVYNLNLRRKTPTGNINAISMK